MGMSSSVIGIRKATDAHRKKVEAVFALKAAGIKSLPKELSVYFGELSIDNIVPTTGLEVPVKTFPYNHANGDGFEVPLEGLPADLDCIRFVNSY